MKPFLSCICSGAALVSARGISPSTGIDHLEGKLDLVDECSSRQDGSACDGVSLLQLHAKRTTDLQGILQEAESEAPSAKSADAGRRRKSSSRRRRRRRRRQRRSRGRGRGRGRGRNGDDDDAGDDDVDGDEEEDDEAEEEEEEEAASLSDSDLIADLGLCDSGLDFTGAEVLHSNLGGAGPDAGDATLVYGNVMKGTNLIVSAMSPYTPNTLNAEGGALRNGVHQGFGVINMAAPNDGVDLKFSFVDSKTGAPKVIESFLFTIFDGDHGMSHESRESATVSGFSAFKVKDDTSLEIVEIATDDESLVSGGGVATFTSTMNGGKAGNPLSPLNLNAIQEQKTVVFLFEDKSEFLVTAGESGYAKAQGRNILFAGASALVCEEETKCSSVDCPAGSRHSPDAEFKVCTSIPCSDEDIERCCVEEE